MWKKIALGVAVLVAGLAVVIALQPSEFTVERSATIEAPAPVVYGEIESLRRMDQWQPFARMDPQLAIEYAGPEAGVGARSSWEGPQMGKGRMEITGAEPYERVEMRLDMLEPMAGSNQIRFTLAPADEGTRVTWRMDGRSNFVGKAFALFGDMDAMMGAEFEKGLAALAARVAGTAR